MNVHSSSSAISWMHKARSYCGIPSWPECSHFGVRRRWSLEGSVAQVFQRVQVLHSAFKLWLAHVQPCCSHNLVTPYNQLLDNSQRPQLSWACFAQKSLWRLVSAVVSGPMMFCVPRVWRELCANLWFHAHTCTGFCSGNFCNQTSISFISFTATANTSLTVLALALLSLDGSVTMSGGQHSGLASHSRLCHQLCVIHVAPDSRGW